MKTMQAPSTKGLRALPVRAPRAARGLAGKVYAVQAPITPTPAPAAPAKDPWEGLDPKEKDRVEMRTVYFHEDWHAHRHSNRFLRHLLSIPSSRVVKSVFPTVLAVTALAGGINIYETAVAAGLFPADSPHVPDASNVLGIMSTALSLLLVFRTKESYGRWDEARKMWGLLINRSRDLYRQVLTYGEDPATFDAVRRWLKVFIRSFKNHMRYAEDTRKELSPYLNESELEAMVAAKHKPVFALQVLSDLVRRTPITKNPIVRVSIEQNITAFEDILGGCERLLRAPIPVSYTRNTSRFLSLWLIALPFGLYAKYGWDSVPFTALISFIFLTIEEIGVTIEEPFSILPCEAMADTMGANFDQLYDTYTKSEKPDQDFERFVSQDVLALHLKGQEVVSSGAGFAKISGSAGSKY